MKLCDCGCGQPAPIATLTNRRYGHVKGQPMRFVVGHNAKGKALKPGSYRMVRTPGHPKAAPGTHCVAEHVLIAERALGRYLPAGVEIHHADENTLNNSTANLVICQDRRYHNLLHVRARVLRAGGNPNTQRVCCDCRQPKDFSEFNVSRSNVNGGVTSRCRECNRAASRRAA